MGDILEKWKVKKRTRKMSGIIYDLDSKKKEEIKFCVYPGYTPEFNVAAYYWAKGYEVGITSGYRHEGMPDVKCERKSSNEKFYVEIKSKSGSISLPQLDFWLTKTDRPVKIWVMEFSGRDYREHREKQIKKCVRLNIPKNKKVRA